METSKNMDCAQVGELASEYVEGCLPGALGRAVQSHADGCVACRRDLSALRELWAELDALPDVEPPPFFRENLIGRIERQEGESRRAAPSWRALFPHIGRLALGTAATGLAVAAVAWTLMLPDSGPIKGQMTPTQRVLPGQPAPPVSATRPRLIIAQARVVDDVNGPAYEFVPRLEGAERGTLRIHLLKSALQAAGEEKGRGGVLIPPVPASPLPANPNKTPADLRAVLGMGKSVPAWRVPLTAVPGEKCISLYVYWTAEGAAHSTYLFVPILENDALIPAPRQSFGLPTERLPEAARMLASRYGQAVLLEDVPDDLSVTIVPYQESLAEVLGRSLTGTGLVVSPADLPESGLRIAPAR